MGSCQLELKGKLMGEVEVKSSSTALFHLYVDNPHQFPNFYPSIVQSCRLEHGKFDMTGPVIVWKYNSGGKFCVVKEILENVDFVNKSVTYRSVEGDIMNNYKTFLTHLRFIPQTNNCNILQWTLDYEKLNEDVDEPTALLDSLLDVAKRADAYLLQC